MKNKSNKIKIKAENFENLSDELAVNLWETVGSISMPEYEQDDVWDTDDEDLVDILDGRGNGEYDYVGDYVCQYTGTIYVERLRSCGCTDESVEYTIYAIRGRRKDISDDTLAVCDLIIAQRSDYSDGYIVLHDEWDDVDMDGVVSSIWWSPTEYTYHSCCDRGEGGDDMGYYCIINTED